MTEKDLSRIEDELGIHLPREYREVVLTRGAELRSLTHELGGATYPFFESSLYLDPELLVLENICQRRPDAAAAYAFPGWWKEYFIFGSNGGGDYYCLRLDGTEDVWFLCCDSHEVSWCCGSLPEYVEEELERYQDSQHDKGIVYQGAAGQDDPNAKEWLQAQTPYPMFDDLGRTVTTRKLRLFGIECCRRIWSLMTDEECRGAVMVAEHLVEGQVTREEANRLRGQLMDKYLALCEMRDPDKASEVRLWCIGAANNLLEDEDEYLGLTPVRKGDADLLRVWQSASSAVGHHYAADLRRGVPGELQAELRAQAELLREILGNPLRPVRFGPRWRSSTAVALAGAIYEEREFERMPLLADALIGAGCDDKAILNHCRGEGRHVRGCWVLDAVLARS